MRELKGFQRVQVPCPAAGVLGEPVPVSFELRTTNLRLVDEDGSYRTISGKYAVWIGATGPGPQGQYVDGAQFAAPLQGELSVLA